MEELDKEILKEELDGAVLETHEVSVDTSTEGVEESQDKIVESCNVDEKIREESREKGNKRFTILGVEFFYLSLLAIVVAFIGWLAENSLKAIFDGIIDARFHMLPFISPYGLIIFALHIALGNPDSLVLFGKKIFKSDNKKSKIMSNIITLLVIYMFVFLGEFVVGNMWDVFFGVELWNYSSMPFHVTQYAGLIPTLGYGTATYLLFKFGYMPALNFVRRKVKYNVAKWITLILGSLIVLDTLRMSLCIIIFNEAPMLWRIYL